MTNDWITLNSIAMYEQRLRDIENERLARSVAARKPRSKIMRTALANLGQQMIVLGERLQHRGTATARIRASG